MRRPRCYIAGPISKGCLAHNLNQGTEAFLALATAGIAPFCPMWSAYSKPVMTHARFGPAGELSQVVTCRATVQGNDRMTHEDWLGIDLEWVGVSDCVLRLPGESVGADRETTHAATNGIPVFFAVDDVVRWSRDRAKGE